VRLTEPREVIFALAVSLGPMLSLGPKVHRNGEKKTPLPRCLRETGVRYPKDLPNVNSLPIGRH
jgi:hypothetical protein